MKRYGLPKELKNGLVLYLPGEVSGTTAFDFSGNGNNGTLVNTPTVQRRQGYKCWNFNGSTQSISIPNITGLLSFSAYIYPTANTKTIILVSTGNSIDLSASNTITFTGITGGIVYVNGSTVNTITLNKWNHISCTFNSINSSSGNIANSSFAGLIANPMLHNSTLSTTLIQLYHKAFFIP